MQYLGFSLNEEATKKVISKSYLNFSVVAINKMIEQNSFFFSFTFCDKLSSA